MHTCTCQNADQMSNSLYHYQTADLGVHCLLRYISVPIFGVNTVSYFAANNIIIKVYCINPKKCCSWPIICIIRHFIKSIVEKEVNVATLTQKSLIGKTHSF